MATISTKRVQRARPARAAKQTTAAAVPSGADDLLRKGNIDRKLNAVLARARYVGLRPARPLFDSEFHDVWLFGKKAASIMRMPAGAYPMADKTRFIGSLKHRMQAVRPSAREVADDTRFVKELARALKGVVESSDIDCPYYPFALYAKAWTKKGWFGFLPVGGLNTDLSRNLAPGETFRLDDLTRRELFTMDLDDGEEPTEYYAPRELEAVRRATQMLRTRCGKVYRFTLSEGDGGRRAVPLYPVFTFGISKLGNATGVFTLRSDAG